MHHKPHIGLVDPHTEGIGCHNDLIFIIYKIILVSFSLRVPQSRMIPGHGKSVTAELFTDLLHSLSGQTVHNSAVIRMHLQIILQHCIFILWRLYPKFVFWGTVSKE